MFEFSGSPVPVRDDVVYAHRSLWHHIARPGPTLTGEQRVRMLAGARADDPGTVGLGVELGRLAAELYHRPIGVNGDMVTAAVDAAGDPTTVEVLALISMLSAIDGTHRGLGLELEPLPAPVAGDPTGQITDGLKRRRTHIPVPPGPIPVMFDLLPMEGAVFQSLFGPHYMTGWEMALDTFERRPGLNRAQMELVSSRTSIHNECFY